MSDQNNQQNPIFAFLQRLEESFSSLDQKVDRLDKRLDGVDKTLIKQEANLETHIMRTDIAEKNLEILRTESKKEFDLVKKDVNYTKRHVVVVEAVLKFAGGAVVLAGTVLGIIVAILKLSSLLT